MRADHGEGSQPRGLCPTAAFGPDLLQVFTGTGRQAVGPCAPKGGGTRELIVGLLQQAGIPVPAIDVERPDMRRRRRVA